MTLEPTLITMLFDFENASDEGRTDMFEEAVGRMIAAENELSLLRAELHQRAHDAVGAETELEAANGRLARMRSIIKNHSFAVVLSGETGKRFVRCKECHGDNENKNESDFDFTHVQHFSPCSVAAALKETE